MPTTSRKVHQRSTSAQAQQLPRPTEEQTTSQVTASSGFPKPRMEDYDSSWLEMDDLSALDIKVDQLRALANAMYCVAYLDFNHPGFNYLGHREAVSQPLAVETLAPLSLCSQRLCDEVEYHIAVLATRLRTYKEKGSGGQVIQARQQRAKRPG